MWFKKGEREYRIRNGKRYRVIIHKGRRNKRTREFHRYGDSSVFLNDGKRHPNRGKPFMG